MSPKDYMGHSRQRDTGNAAVFIREFKEYENNYDSPNPRGSALPNFVVMSLGEGPYPRAPDLEPSHPRRRSPATTGPSARLSTQ